MIGELHILQYNFDKRGYFKAGMGIG